MVDLGDGGEGPALVVGCVAEALDLEEHFDPLDGGDGGS